MFWSTNFEKYSNLIEIRPVGAEFHAGGRTDGETDMTKLIVAFPNFPNAESYGIIAVYF
jgi:hypothetical protein